MYVIHIICIIKYATLRERYGDMDKSDNFSLYGSRIAPTLKITRKFNVQGV